MTASPSSVSLRFVVLLTIGTVSCTAILGDFTVGAGTTSGVDGGDAATEGPVDAAADAPADAGPRGLAGVKQVTAGARHTCALDTKGDVYCWGDNADGQVARGAAVARAAAPLKVSLPGAASAVVAGAFHTCAVVGADIHCWGRNACGQTGAGDTDTPAPAPRKVKSLPIDLQWAFVAPGLDHTCAADLGGGTYCWGCNARSQAGEIGATPSLVAKNAGADKIGYSMMSASVTHTCAASAGGTSCWGTEDTGQLGNGPPGNDSTTAAVAVKLGSQAKAIATGDRHTCALDANGNVLCWGANDQGQLGFVVDGGPGTAEPGGRIAAGPFSAVAAGGALTCVIGAQGSVVRCAGSNSQGQLGRGGAPDNAPHPVTQPVVAPGTPGSPLVASGIGVGREHACAIIGPASEVVCWGNGTDGQVGDGMPGGPPRSAPVRVVAPM